ncbi:DNA methyltransferase [Rhodococcus sp. NBC_00297]|uniref:DNA methyltransferase n=1 Tax=Rhodococcus sp. NBC_00297 TaxID=2976005 RepID=UPI002E2968D7|nr:DNA methyltransferase [Rhodococcus sp. NBC_00297]
MSSATDAFVLGEEFVSEHYFTTDATSQSFHAKVLAVRKEWDTVRDEGHATPRTRFVEQRAALLRTMLQFGENSDRSVVESLYGTILDALGYTGGSQFEVDRVGATDTERGPVLTVKARGLIGPAPLVIVEADANLSVEQLLARDEKSLLTPFRPNIDDSETLYSVAKTVSNLVTDDDGPQFVLVLAGSTALLTARGRWPEGRYLAVDLRLVAERADDKRGGETDRALACLSADGLAPNAEGDLWWASVIAESAKHTVGVSKDLREGVRLSIEIIANDVVARRRDAGLDQLSSVEARDLGSQSLRLLYRVLFLLYAEAKPELGVLPVGDPTYSAGYSLDRLRELLLVDLVTPRAESGTHLFDSLGLLCRRVDQGYDGGSDAASLAEGLVFRRLEADLFADSAIPLIDEVRLGNAAMQRVLRHLLLSKEVRGRDRGFISYAELGINQLGAVYEGLMSYTGFLAEETLYEVAKNGDPSKGTWVVPERRIDGVSAEDYVRIVDEHSGELVPVRHERGTFVFRLAGRERQQSASYYTPEVLTRFTVGQALAELLDQDGETTSAADILGMTVCEPALGSGAFAVEAVRQLAREYLVRRERELNEKIDPELYPIELQKVKASIALHQVYGVDLNATAVEFAEISMWLDTMVRDLEAPWFGLRLRRGNSLIGARRALIPGAELRSRGWLDATPVDVGLADVMPGEQITAPKNGIHHFLVPTSGWGSTVAAKDAKELAPEHLAGVKAWQKTLRTSPTAKQVTTLVGLAARVETLWLLATRRFEIAEAQVARDLHLWGAAPAEHPAGPVVTRAVIEASLADPDGAYRRLRRVMDAWCALWFWPLVDSEATVNGVVVAPPTLAEWVDTLTDLLGSPIAKTTREKRDGQMNLFDIRTWTDLDTAEGFDRTLSGARPVTDVLTDRPWLAVAERVSQRQGFFHWELDFASVFRRGGFDLQVGNPPWVRPRSDVDALLSEGDPWFSLATKPTQAEYRLRRSAVLEEEGIRDLAVAGTSEVAAVAAFVGDRRQYPHLDGLQPDLYRCFMERTWQHRSSSGIVTLIHPESHFTDEKAGFLREATYARLRRHWQFVNEMALYEIHNLVTFGVNVYGRQNDPGFLSAASLYSPDTVDRSLIHDGTGVEPGLKDPDGNWDLRPHAGRIITVDDTVLESWKNVLEDAGVPARRSRMVYTVNSSAAAVLEKLAAAPRVGELGLLFSPGWHEKNDRTKGYFDSSWGAPESWDDVILQGPHIHVGNPAYKTPNSTMSSNKDWSPVDLENLPADWIPATSYKPLGERSRYDAAYTSWQIPDEDGLVRTVRAVDCNRVVWRRMAANTGERTLISAMLPPGPAPLYTLYSVALPQRSVIDLVAIGAIMTSLVADFEVRSVPKSDLLFSTITRLPWISDQRIRLECAKLYGRLAFVGSVFNGLREDLASALQSSDTVPSSARVDDTAPTAVQSVPQRYISNPASRRQAQIEIDALVAFGLGVTADELCATYRTQFPVLFGYDRKTYLYDSNGRLVPQSVLVEWRKRGDSLSLDQRTATNASGNTYVYELPFQFLDREKDMREAYAVFERRFGIGGSTPPIAQKSTRAEGR